MNTEIRLSHSLTNTFKIGGGLLSTPLALAMRLTLRRRRQLC
jgi:hypothetical protein